MAGKLLVRNTDSGACFTILIPVSKHLKTAQYPQQHPA